MLRSSSLAKRGTKRVVASYASAGLASCWALLAASAAAQPGITPQSPSRTVSLPPAAAVPAEQAGLAERAKPVFLTLPLKDNTLYLGDIGATISPDNRVSLPSQRLLDLLASIVDAKIVETLRGSLDGSILVDTKALEPVGIQIQYNPQSLELVLTLPSALRATRDLAINRLDRPMIGSFAEPAKISAFLNIRGASTHVEGGSEPGWGQPVFFLDGAARLGQIVIENRMIVEPAAASGHPIQRQGTRLIYDDPVKTLRWTGLDLQTVGRGFQSPQDTAGLSVYRSYSVLEPQSLARPRGDRRFSLERPSTIEVYVNGQIVRRLVLGPGTYNLTDFPFAQGANDVRLSITDDSGRNEVLRFNLFIDQTQLAPGLSEFGLYGGVKAPLGPSGPRYSNDWQVSGFYRRGINDALTLGGNLQADSTVQMAGMEAIISTAAGLFGTNLALSNVKAQGTGYAAAATFQKAFERANGRFDALNLSFETRSKAFGAAGTTIPLNPYRYELGLGYSHSFNAATYGGLDARYSSARAGFNTVQTYRATLGWRLSPSLNLTTDTSYQKDERGDNISALLSLTLRLGRYTSARADYDTRGNKTRLAYQALKGSGVGAYSLSADLDRADAGASFNLAGNYTANRAELGISHFSTADRDLGQIQDQRTTVRFATALAFADGAVAMGRPVHDGFAILVPHKTLKGVQIMVDPSPYGYQASSGWLGAALSPNLTAFAPRAITINAPTAPAGVDLGQGTYRVFTPYRAGYRLSVGSDYAVTAIGQLVDQDAQPLSIVSGTALELADPNREPLTVFTNRDGRFGLTGLRPGRWRITMMSDPPTRFDLVIAGPAMGMIKAGVLKPLEEPSL